MSKSSVTRRFNFSSPMPAMNGEPICRTFSRLTCEELAGDTERKRMLFAYTVVSSIAVDSVSAVERLLTGAHRRDYEDFVKKWRERIERITPLAPAWIAARLLP